jgi:hypothetical protein
MRPFFLTRQRVEYFVVRATSAKGVSVRDEVVRTWHPSASPELCVYAAGGLDFVQLVCEGEGAVHRFDW